MPLYEYECKQCKKRFEKIQSFSAPAVKKCIYCGGSVKKLISASAIRFKGTGWYVTDYAKKEKATDKKVEPAEKKAESTDSKVSPKKEKTSAK